MMLIMINKEQKNNQKEKQYKHTTYSQYISTYKDEHTSHQQQLLVLQYVYMSLPVCM